MKMNEKTMTIPDLRSLYYHRDFDGAVSAAMLIAIARRPLRLHPVDYHLTDIWASMALEQPAAIVDFLFHPDAILWIDHHTNPFVVESWKETFSQRPFHIWIVDAPSCPPLLKQALPFPSQLLEHFHPYIYWSSIIDSARYESPEQATDLTNPFLLLSEVLAIPGVEKTANRIVEEISQHDVKTVLSAPDIEPLARSVTEAENDLRNRLLPRITCDGLVAFLDQSDIPSRFQRYYPYLRYPNAAYVVGIYRHDHGVMVSVGANPWKGGSEINIGRVCGQFGGGGRKNVGGIAFDNSTTARIVANKIIGTLHEMAYKSLCSVSAGPGIAHCL